MSIVETLSERIKMALSGVSENEYAIQKLLPSELHRMKDEDIFSHAERLRQAHRAGRIIRILEEPDLSLSAYIDLGYYDPSLSTEGKIVKTKCPQGVANSDIVLLDSSLESTEQSCIVGVVIPGIEVPKVAITERTILGVYRNWERWTGHRL